MLIKSLRVTCLIISFTALYSPVYAENSMEYNLYTAMEVENQLTQAFKPIFIDMLDCYHATQDYSFCIGETDTPTYSGSSQHRVNRQSGKTTDKSFNLPMIKAYRNGFPIDSNTRIEPRPPIIYTKPSKSRH